MTSTIAVLTFGQLILSLGYALENCTNDHRIQFITQPRSTKVCPNGTAYFSCAYTGSRQYPNWLIGSTPYASNNLPANTTYDVESSALIVTNAVISQDYYCYFNLVVNNKICVVQSTVGRLELYTTDTCICQEDERFEGVCSCLQDNAVIALPQDLTLSSTDSDVFSIFVFCYYPMHAAFELKIRVKSQSNYETEHLVLCTNPSSLLSFPNIQYDGGAYLNVSAYITSFEEQSLREECLITTDYIDLLSPNFTESCADRSTTTTVILGVYLLFISFCLTVSMILYCFTFYYRRRPKHTSRRRQVRVRMSSSQLPENFAEETSIRTIAVTENISKDTILCENPMYDSGIDLAKQ